MSRFLENRGNICEAKGLLCPFGEEVLSRFWICIWGCSFPERTFPIFCISWNLSIRQCWCQCYFFYLGFCRKEETMNVWWWCASNILLKCVARRLIFSMNFAWSSLLIKPCTSRKRPFRDEWEKNTVSCRCSCKELWKIIITSFCLRVSCDAFILNKRSSIRGTLFVYCCSSWSCLAWFFSKRSHLNITCP